jgi:hypothetical protein
MKTKEEILKDYNKRLLKENLELNNENAELRSEIIRLQNVGIKLANDYEAERVSKKSFAREIVEDILQILENEHFGGGAASRDEYQSRVIHQIESRYLQKGGKDGSII